VPRVQVQCMQGRARGRARARDPQARGLPGQATTGPHLWETASRSCCRCSITTCPKRRGDAPRSGVGHARFARERGSRARSRARLSVADDPRAGVSGYGPPERPHIPHVQRGYSPCVRGRHHAAVLGPEFETRCWASELLEETTRLWRSLGHHGRSGALSDRRVTDPTSTERSRQQRYTKPVGAGEPA